MFQRLIPCLLLLSSQPQQSIKASDLKVVSGPNAPCYPDPAQGPGLDRMEFRLRQAARQGVLPAVEVPSGTQVVEDRISGQAGWKAYFVQAPAGAKVKVRLQGEHTAWFWMTAVDKWGKTAAGMLQNRIKTGNPEASFINPKQDQASPVFFIVDTQETNMNEAYTLTFTWE